MKLLLALDSCCCCWDGALVGGPFDKGGASEPPACGFGAEIGAFAMLAFEYGVLAWGGTGVGCCFTAFMDKPLIELVNCCW